MKNGQQIPQAKSLPHRVIRLFSHLLIVPLLFALLPNSVSGQGKAEGTTHLSRGDAEAIADRIIQPAMREKQLPSLVLGVVKNGQVVVKKGYGVKSLATGGLPDENTVYYIASLSKAITAVGVMLLVEQGKLDLNAPASRYLKGLPAAWQPITVAQFMAHQSGIPKLKRHLPTYAAMLRSADIMPLSFAPGAKHEYNNFNFVVAGKIIEAVSGTSYLDYMKRNVFGPLGMDSTGYGITGPNKATGYRPTPRGPQPIKRQFTGGPYWIPSHHLQSTLADLLKFYEALRTGKLLKPATYEQMVTRVNPNLSGTPGWYRYKTRAGGDSIVTKRGAIFGFMSNMSLVSGKGDAVVLLWTSQKQKERGLHKQLNELLREICGVGVRDEPDPGDEP